MQLNAFVDDPALGVGKSILSHSRSDTVQLTRDELLNAIVDEDTADPSFGLALRKLETCILQIEQRFAEGFPFFNVVRRNSNGLFGRATALRPIDNRSYRN